MTPMICSQAAARGCGQGCVQAAPHECTEECRLPYCWKFDIDAPCVPVQVSKGRAATLQEAPKQAVTKERGTYPNGVIRRGRDRGTQRKFSQETRLAACADYAAGKLTVRAVCEKHSTTMGSLYKWLKEAR